MAQGVITDTGREKLCRAHAGEISLPRVAKMAFGNGGVDLSSNVLETTGKETGLKSQLLVKNIDSYSFPSKTTCKYTVRLNETELAGEFISEQGLFDEEGDLIAYKTFMPKGKDGDVAFEFDMSEIF